VDKAKGQLVIYVDDDFKNKTEDWKSILNIIRHLFT